MKKNLLVLVCILVMALGFTATASAAEKNDNLLGYVNIQYVWQTYPGIQDVTKVINTEKARLQGQFNEQTANLSKEEQNSLGAKLSQQMAAFEQEQLAPINKKIQQAIQKAAKANGVANVVNANILLYGGKDLTQEVVDSLK